MSLEYAILGFLAVEPLSGYDLKTRCLDEESRHFWTADQAQVYRTLERLSVGGFVKSTRERQTGKPDRKVFRITASGLDALASWLSETRSTPARKDPFLLQLFFSAGLTDDVLADLLAEHRQVRQSRLEDIRGEIGALARARHMGSRDIAMRRMALDGAAAAERAAIDWLDDCLDLTSRGLPGSPEVRPGEQSQLFPNREKGRAT